MFEVAATHGHVRGQYELARLLLDGIGGDSRLEQGKGDVSSQNDDTTKAVQWLCKASEKGYYVPSYTLLAETLIDTAEKACGSVSIVGKSPLPRALQILSLTEDGYHGNSEKKQADELLKRYGCKQECCNCGAKGSENNPLMTCAGCGVVSFCSKICQRRCFRDGHRFDCCSYDRLFDFHLIKLSLPWVKDNMGWKGRESLPLLIPDKRGTLMEMIEDDTDEIYGEGELEYDEHITVQLMLRMRNNLETYLGRKLGGDASAGGYSRTDVVGTGDLTNLKLWKRIDLFAKMDAHVSNDFSNAMHKIRELGNYATHRSPDDAELDQKESEEAVRVYRRLKKEYEIKKSRMQPETVSSEASATTVKKPKHKSKKKKKRRKK
mmetsp:Transcript_20066/g.43526  ORF Transcript_20066/g.43526 Transcript_20066/m.43526 type:complete len:378 (-) Transcript_20066:28-1161(-)